MGNKKTLSQSPKFKKAFNKVKKYVLNLRRENNEDTSKRHINIIIGFFEYQNIEYLEDNKKSLQLQLYELYLNGHTFFGKKQANSQKQKDKLLVNHTNAIKKAKNSWIKRYLSDPFFGSEQWKNLRKQVFAKYGKKCMKCGNTKRVMHVDHIKPRSKHPHLEFDFNNLQVLCAPCNVKKSNIDETDYRNIKITITIERN